MDDFFDSFKKSVEKHNHTVKVVHFKKEPYDIYIGRIRVVSTINGLIQKSLEKVFLLELLARSSWPPTRNIFFPMKKFIFKFRNYDII